MSATNIRLIAVTEKNEFKEAMVMITDVLVRKKIPEK